MVSELADLAMQLARAAAARALVDLTTEPAPASDPHAPDPSEPPPEALADPQAAQIEPPPPPAGEAQALKPRVPSARTGAPRLTTPKPIDPALLFTRLTVVIRDLILLEARLAGTLPSANPAPTFKPRPRPPHLSDPRREPMQEMIRLSAAQLPIPDAKIADAEIRLDEILIADPDRTWSYEKLINTVFDESGIKFRPDKILNKHLDILRKEIEINYPEAVASYTDPP